MPKIPIEVSARHLHLSQEHLEELFGKKYKLKVLKSLSQKGEFACKEVVILESEKARIENVRVLGPVRERTQVELSATDAYTLRIKPPLRLSGDLQNSGNIKLIGPKGEVDLQEGVIIAKRHIHASPNDARDFGFRDGEEVSVEIGDERGLIFHNVTVRVKDNYVLRMHIDTDEGNAAGIVGEGEGKVMV